MQDVIHQLIEVLKDQRDMFGDDLFENIKIPDISIQNIPMSMPAEKMNIKSSEETMDFPENVEFQSAENLIDLNKLICNCLKCPLGKTRNKFVFGVGNPNADILLVGEGPGADEDLQGEPFVGRAGKLLNDILKAIKFERENVYIANIIKCRPPGNRNPLPDEMEKCLPYLIKQIEIIKPKLIMCLGLVAAGALLKTKQSLTKLRGNIYQFENSQVMVTYHPAALLRNPHWKRGCWEDVQKFRNLYDEIISK